MQLHRHAVDSRPLCPVCHQPFDVLARGCGVLLQTACSGYTTCPQCPGKYCVQDGQLYKIEGSCQQTEEGLAAEGLVSVKQSDCAQQRTHRRLFHRRTKSASE